MNEQFPTNKYSDVLNQNASNLHFARMRIEEAEYRKLAREVKEDDCFVTIENNEVVRNIRVSDVIISTKIDGSVYVLKQINRYNEFVEGVGGKVKIGESFIRGASREIFEEIGILITEAQLAPAIEYDRESSDYKAQKTYQYREGQSSKFPTIKTEYRVAKFKTFIDSRDPRFKKGGYTEFNKDGTVKAQFMWVPCS